MAAEESPVEEAPAPPAASAEENSVEEASAAAEANLSVERTTEEEPTHAEDLANLSNGVQAEENEPPAAALLAPPVSE